MELIRLLVDTGFFILIWLVQVIIYPSFTYIDGKKLNYWHQQYTRKITFFVAPMMLLQTGVIAFQILSNPLVYLIDGILISILWINTFFIAIPIHQAIHRAEVTEYDFLKLLKVNWWRTLLWSILFLLSLWRVLV